MKKAKAIKYLPLILSPYACLLGLAFIILVYKCVLPAVSYEAELFVFWGSVVLAVLVGLALFGVGLAQAIVLLIKTLKGSYGLSEANKLLMLVKLWQIPAYVFNFLLGCLGVLLSVWGIGIIFLVVAIDYASIALTGLASVGCSLSMKKAHESVLYIFTGIGMFVFCLDVALAVFYYLKQRKSEEGNDSLAPAATNDENVCS